MRERLKEGAWFIGSFLVALVAGSLLIAGCGWREDGAAAQTFDPISLPSPVSDDLTPTDGSRPPRTFVVTQPTVADVGWSCETNTAWVTLEGNTRQLHRLESGVYLLGAVVDSKGETAVVQLNGAVRNGLGDLIVTCIAEPLVIERVATTTTAKIGICG